MPRSGIARPCMVMFDLRRTCQMSPRLAAPFYIPPTVCEASSFSSPQSSWHRHLVMCCGFDWHFPGVMAAVLPCAHRQFVCLPWRRVCSCFLLTVNRVICLLLLTCEHSFIFLLVFFFPALGIGPGECLVPAGQVLYHWAPSPVPVPPNLC